MAGEAQKFRVGFFALPGLRNEIRQEKKEDGESNGFLFFLLVSDT